MLRPSHSKMERVNHVLLMAAVIKSMKNAVGVNITARHGFAHRCHQFFDFRGTLGTGLTFIIFRYLTRPLTHDLVKDRGRYWKLLKFIPKSFL